MLALYCGVYAWKNDLPLTQMPSRAEVWSALKKASWGLGLPVVLLGGIYSGVFTPTESAAIACIYGLFVGVFVYRQIRARELIDILKLAGLISATLLLITAGASALSWLLATTGAPTDIAKSMLEMTESRIGILVVLNIILLLAGCVLDGASAVIILAPLLEPIAREVGIDPVHFGIITLINVEIGMLTPPVGLNLFVACKITGMSLGEVVRSVLPSLGILLLGLLIITYVPWLSLFLPGLMYV